MNGYYKLLLLICMVEITIAKRGHRHRHRYGNHHGTGRSAAALLPPPTDDISSSESGEPARGLKGMSNPLASLQKTHSKCIVEGSYGIKAQCSKYMECRGKGQIPSYRYCPSGKFFDQIKRICINSGEAMCTDVCKEEGQLYQDPNDSKAFLKCMRGVPMPEICSDGQFYSVSKSSCSASADVETNSEE